MPRATSGPWVSGTTSARDDDFAREKHSVSQKTRANGRLDEMLMRERVCASIGCVQVV